MAYVYNSQLASLPPRALLADAFDLYHKIQESTEPPTSILGGPALPALGHALAGSIGSAISNVAVFPLDLVITRLQVQRQLRKNSSTRDDAEYKDVPDAFRKIYGEEGGWKAFYTGVVQDTGKSMMDAFLFFLAYNFLRQRRLQAKGGRSKTLPVLEELNVGFVAGAVAKLLTTPIANIVTRKQTDAMVAARSGRSDETSQMSVADIARAIHHEKGLRGFWSGYSASLVLTLNPSLTFFLFEFLKRVLIPRSRRDDPGGRAIFLLAAVSKAIASSITYPFSLAKARAQASNRSRTTEKTADTDSSPPKPAQRPTTVFSTVFQIGRTEGVTALYEGLTGEVLKGFFSHGTTMIVKESVHKLIIQLYYLLLRASKRYPAPSDLARSVADNAQEAGEKVQRAAENITRRGG
ncbi:MAG: Histone H4 [Chaenotheca gracillima]|nr:MAG: Histone H4 [Chaenotheca gracillima]